MEYQANHHSMYVKRPFPREKNPAVRWFKEWVPHEVASTGKKCYLLKWVTEDMLKSLREKDKEPEPEEPKPEPTTEVLFLCSYEGCAKSFTDVGAFRKHSQIHGERQYACPVEGCGKKFLDSSKLKRHLIIHTGARDFVCPHEGCGKAFNLDFNLKAHMRTHSVENYHVCPECGRRYTNESKLKTHIKSHHEKSTLIDMMKHTPPPDRLHSTSKPLTKSPQVVYGSPSSNRPYACPKKGCGKAYIHEYKLNLHFREHPGHNTQENSQRPAGDHGMEEASDQDAYIAKGLGKNVKRSKPTQKMPPAKISHRKGSNLAPSNNKAVRNQWLSTEMYEDDSEETEEDRENVEEDGWRYQEANGDDEETEDEE